MDDQPFDIDKIQAEINKAIIDLEKSEKLEERVQLSELIKNLSQTLEIFYNIATDMITDETLFSNELD